MEVLRDAEMAALCVLMVLAGCVFSSYLRADRKRELMIIIQPIIT